jgi:uncharacterized Zn finger protein (UPF0148 family)
LADKIICPVHDKLSVTAADVKHFFKTPKNPQTAVDMFCKGAIWEEKEKVEKEVRIHIRNLIDSGDIWVTLDWKLASK